MDFYENVVFVIGMAEFVWPRNSSDPDTTMNALQAALDASGQLFCGNTTKRNKTPGRGALLRIVKPMRFFGEVPGCTK
jgi:hypothetical protein